MGTIEWEPLICVCCPYLCLMKPKHKPIAQQTLTAQANNLKPHWKTKLLPCQQLDLKKLQTASLTSSGRPKALVAECEKDLGQKKEKA